MIIIIMIMIILNNNTVLDEIDDGEPRYWLNKYKER